VRKAGSAGEGERGVVGAGEVERGVERLLDLLDAVDASVNPRAALEGEDGTQGVAVAGPVVEADAERSGGVEEEVPLAWVRDRHVAFVGDSLARNQCESLVCLLTSAFPAQLVRGVDGGDCDGDGDELRKFRRRAFPSHNATVSVFWSPFLVNGTERLKSPTTTGSHSSRGTHSSTTKAQQRVQQQEHHEAPDLVSRTAGGRQCRAAGTPRRCYGKEEGKQRMQRARGELN